MERYAPTIKDLAPRDIVARSMVQRSARVAVAARTRTTSTSISPTCLLSRLETKLPDITEFSRTYLGVDPVTEPVPVFPTAHYAMGGIPTNITPRFSRDNEHVVPGLYAAGEVPACRCTGQPPGHQLPARHQRVRRRAGIAAAEYANSVELARAP